MVDLTGSSFVWLVLGEMTEHDEMRAAFPQMSHLLLPNRRDGRDMHLNVLHGHVSERLDQQCEWIETMLYSISAVLFLHTLFRVEPFDLGVLLIEKGGRESTRREREVEVDRSGVEKIQSGKARECLRRAKSRG